MTRCHICGKRTEEVYEYNKELFICKSCYLRLKDMEKGIYRCHICNKKWKKADKYSYKADCNCLKNKGLRLMVGKK